VLINVCYDPKTGQVDRPPDTIAQLFEAFTAKLFSETMEKITNSSGMPPFPVQDVALALNKLGAEMTYEMGMTTVVPWEWALRQLPIPFADQILEFACESRILCRPQEHQDLRFTHQLLQEYFASLELQQHMSRPKFLALLREPWWEETILLLADTVENPDDLIDKILQAQSPPNSYTLRLAAECIARRRKDCLSETIENVRNRLAGLLKKSYGLTVCAIRALSYLDDEASVKLIEESLHHHEDWIRETAIESLISMEHPTAREALRAYIRGQKPIPSIVEAFRVAQRRGWRESYDLPAAQLARLVLGVLLPIALLAGCGAIIYIYQFVRDLTASGALTPTPTPTPSPTPNPTFLGANEVGWGCGSVCLPILGLVFALGMLALAIRPRDFFAAILDSAAEFRLPLDRYMDPVRSGIIPGLIAGFGVLIVWGVYAGEFPLSRGQAVSIPLLVASYSFYLSWAWAVIRWFFDERKAEHSPLDQLAFSTSGGVFVAHLAIVLVLVAGGLVVSLRRPVAPLDSVIWAVVIPGGGLSLVHRLALLSESILILALIVLPGFAGILSMVSYFRYLKDKRVLNAVQREWYDLSPSEKGKCLKEQVLPIAFGEHKRPSLSEHGVQVLSELRIEDVQDPKSREEMLREVLVQLANLYRSPGKSGISGSIQKTYVAVRDRYLKRPIKARDRAIVSLLSVVLEEVYPPFETLESARSVAYAKNPELKLGY